MSNYTVHDQAAIAGKFLRVFGFGTFSMKRGSENYKKVVVKPVDYFFFVSNVLIASTLGVVSLKYYSGLLKESKLVSMGAMVTMKLRNYPNSMLFI